MSTILSTDNKCELISKPDETITPCEGCYYNKGCNGCVASDLDTKKCMGADFNNEGTYIFKDIQK